MAKRRYAEIKRNRERVRKAHQRANTSETNKKTSALVLRTYRLGSGEYEAMVCFRGSEKRCGGGLASTPSKAAAEALEHLSKRVLRERTK